MRLLQTTANSLGASLLAASLVPGVLLAQPDESDALDTAMAGLWAADAPAAVAGASEQLVRLAPSFDEVYARLRRGRRYRAGVDTGRLRLERVNRDGVEHAYEVVIPANYTPEVRYPVHVYLHGGVSAPKGTRRWREPDRYLTDEAIVVLPEAWRESLWWNESQVENLAGILRTLKRSYNVDENRVFLLGISDGGSGLYYQVSRDATPWTGFLPFIGHPAVVANPRTGVDGQLYVRNMASRPFLIINLEGGRLYPAAGVQPFITAFEAAGMSVRFVVRPESGHHMRWWPDEQERIGAFLSNTVREPLPRRLSWETDRVDRFNRHHWLVVTELGGVPRESSLDALNTVVLAVAPTRPEGLERLMFPHDAPSGRVAVTADGNTVEAQTTGVRRLTILVSSDMFDLSGPIRVVANGQVVFDASVEPDLATLLRWAARDDDRGMLFAAEIDVALEPGG
jgi:predicted esterase